ncbi:hypothetical protein [Agromyces aerolatus]|uniref:hypothetical protein n=1 Tax=Agromyces sp. LY-1074 TaxID=3074080 RepID=UPI00285D23B0|nr:MULTISPECIES: hypothetical protein [unclassified Agromyces]MDR5701859.1 hypothetical protein [Agromyces sp. LY-1074]MDR5708068.1 hypothetical protein [Agromyces sp. LY-1358]
MGFSPIGLVVSLAVLTPNLLLLRYPPRDGLPDVVVPWPFGWLERAGQALCLVVPAVTSPGGVEWAWSLPTIGCLAAYLALWVRYLVRGRHAHLLFRGPWGLPIPMAILPVLVFLGLSAWLTNPWIAASAVVLAAGHLPTSWLTRGALSA